MNKYNDKVKAGIAYLDQHAYGWRDEIDTESLSMDEEDSCILGQVYGDYFDALEQLGLTQEESCELGFNVAEIVRIIQQNAEELSLTSLPRTSEKCLQNAEARTRIDRRKSGGCGMIKKIINNAEDFESYRNLEPKQPTNASRALNRKLQQIKPPDSYPAVLLVELNDGILKSQWVY